MGARTSIIRSAAREHLRFDLGPARQPVARLVHAGGSALVRLGSLPWRARGFDLFMRLHTAALSPSVDRRIVDRIHQATSQEIAGTATGLWECHDRAVASAVAPFRSSPAADP